MKEFRINEGTLKLVQEKLTALRDTTNSRSELLELSTLLKVLEKLTQIVEPTKPAWDCPQAFTDSLLERYKKTFVKDIGWDGWREAIFAGPTVTSTSSLVGKRVYRADVYEKTDLDKQIGVVKQELITGELIVDFCDTTNSRRWSRPLSRSLLEIVE